MTVRRVSAAAVGMCLVAALAACSSSHKATTGAVGATGSGSSGQAATGTPIVIGTIGSYSGPLASSLGPPKAAIQAWAQWVNSKGGVAGHPIKLVAKDEGGDPAKGLSAVKQLVEQDKVVAIVSDDTSADGSWATYIASKGIPVIGGLTVNTSFATNPDFFPAGANAAALYYRIVALAKTVGPRTGVLYCAEAPGCAQIKPIEDGMAKAQGGISVAVAEKVSASAPDYTAQCQALKDANVQSYYVGTASETVIRIVKACKAQGVTAHLLDGDGTITEGWKSVPALDGMLGVELTYPWFDTSTPAAKEFHDAMSKFAPSLGDSIGPNVTYAWTSGKMFEKAVENIGGGAITSASIKQGLYKMNGETLGGLIGPATFVAGKPGRINCAFNIALQGGKFSLPNGATPLCAPDAVVNGLYGG